MIISDFDNGEALKALIEAERDLFKNNFGQVILGHAVSSIAANYDLVVMDLMAVQHLSLKASWYQAKQQH